MEFYNRIKEICKRHKKVALFVDMDGTIVEYNVFPDGFVTTATKEVFLNAEPLEVVLNNLKKINEIERRPAGPLRASAARIKEATPPQRLPLENKRPLARKRARGLGIKNERTAYRLAAYQSPARRRPVRTSNWGS